MKKLCALLLTLTLCVGLAVPARADLIAEGFLDRVLGGLDPLAVVLPLLTVVAALLLLLWPKKK